MEDDPVHDETLFEECKRAIVHGHMRAREERSFTRVFYGYAVDLNVAGQSYTDVSHGQPSTQLFFKYWEDVVLDGFRGEEAPQVEATCKEPDEEDKS
jgi:hypothetical protein